MRAEIIFLLILTGIDLTIALVAIRKPKVSGARTIILLSLILAFWSTSTLAHEIFPTLPLDRPYTAVLFLSATLAASAQLAFAISFTNRQTKLSQTALILLGVVPIVTQILFWIEPFHDYFFSGQNQLVSLSYATSAGLWARINAFYIYNLIGASVLLLLQVYIRKPRPFFLHSSFLLSTPLPPSILQPTHPTG